MVIMTVIRSQAVHDWQLQFCQPLRQNNIPDLLGTGMRFITRIIHAGMSVIHFEEILTNHFHQVFCSDSVMEVRMI